MIYYNNKSYKMKYKQVFQIIISHHLYCTNNKIWQMQDVNHASGTFFFAENVLIPHKCIVPFSHYDQIRPLTTIAMFPGHCFQAKRKRWSHERSATWTSARCWNYQTKCFDNANFHICVHNQYKPELNLTQCDHWSIHFRYRPGCHPHSPCLKRSQ